MKAWAKNLAWEKACQVGAFEVVDEIYADVEAWASGMEAAAVAYFEVALPNGAFAVGVPDAVAAASVEDFVDIPAADWLQEERDVDQVEEEVLLKAWKEAAFAPPELLNQMME